MVVVMATDDITIGHIEWTGMPMESDIKVVRVEHILDWVVVVAPLVMKNQYQQAMKSKHFIIMVIGLLAMSS